MAFDPVAAARAAVTAAWAAGMKAPPIRGPAEWADAERILGTGESPFPGRWATDRTPYIREPMQRMSLHDPAEEVILKMAAQIAKTQGVLCFIGQIIAEMPCSAMIVTPSISEAITFNKDKLQPLIENTPSVAAKVDPSRSSAFYKWFPGGNVELVGANSSKGLQSRSRRVVIQDEVSEYPFDVDGRGDPVEMADARANAYGRRAKRIKLSTPAIVGSCRISTAYEAGSGGKYYVPCPHCGERQELIFSRLHYDSREPSVASYACGLCGALIPEGAKADMLAAGVWVHARPELALIRPSYALSALYSPFQPWSWVAQRREATRGDPQKDRAFVQQVLGEAWQPTYNTVPHQVLWERRTEWEPKQIPADVLFLEGATDVQADRLEWAVYGFDRDFGQWWIDGGVLPGDPTEPGVWADLDLVLDRQWVDVQGRKWSAESWGIDSGYLSQAVYRYCRRHVPRRRPRVMALDGRPRWNEPAIGAPRYVEVDYLGRKLGSVQLWPVGTWDLKAELISAMMLTGEGPNSAGLWPRGAMRFPTRLDIGFFEQITAEVLNVRNAKNGYQVREWIKTRSRNEQFDLAVYTRALARHDTAGWTDHMWAKLEKQRRTGAQPDHVAVAPEMAPVSRDSAPVAAPQPAFVRPGTVTGRGISAGRRVL